MEKEFDPHQEIIDSIEYILNAEFRTQSSDNPALIGHVQRILLDLQEYYEPVKSYEQLWKIRIENFRKVKTIIGNSKANSTAGQRTNFNKAMEVARLQATRLKNELKELRTMRHKPTQD
jgi:hypothetical protein